jgi:ribulose-phosphate 3-epimerase
VTNQNDTKSIDKKGVIIAPSLAAGNLLRLQDEILALEKAGADALHFDVMDGHFVPLLTIGVPFLEQTRALTKIHLDVHIMVSNPDLVAKDYLNAGADTLTFPIESGRHARRLVDEIHDSGCKAGVAINPGTPWQQAIALLPVLDKVTIMGTKIGLNNILIQVDGGVSLKNIRQLYLAGARDFVAGGAVFTGDLDSTRYAQSIGALRGALALCAGSANK